MSKGFAHLISLLIIAAIGISGIIFLSLKSEKPLVSTTDPTPEVKENLKTYIDSKGRFSFTYPSILKVTNSSEENTENEIFYLETENYKLYASNSYQIQINILSGKNVVTPERYQANVIPNTPDYDNLQDIKKITINNIPAVEKTFKSNIVNGVESGWARYKNYYLYSSSLSVIFQATGPDSNHQIINQILSTFEFIDSTTEDSEGAFCGGIAGIICARGYTCVLDGNYPDAGGKCTKNAVKAN